MSMPLVMGTVTRLMNNNLYAVLNMSVSLYHKVSLTQEALQEVKFWLTEFAQI